METVFLEVDVWKCLEKETSKYKILRITYILTKVPILKECHFRKMKL